MLGFLLSRRRTGPVPAILLVASLCACDLSSPTPTPAATVTFSVAVAGSSMSPPGPLNATKGQTITLAVTTDKDEEIHLHGFDLAFHCKKGIAESKTFSADRTGAFEIEIEDTSTALGTLNVNPS